MAGVNTQDRSLAAEGRRARQMYAQSDAAFGKYRVLFLVIIAAGALSMIGMAVAGVYTVAVAAIVADGERVLMGFAYCFWPAVFGIVVGWSMRSKTRAKRAMLQVARRLSTTVLDGPTALREELAWLDARDWPLTDHVAALRDIPPFGYRLVTTGEVDGRAALVALCYRSHSSHSVPRCARVDIYVATTASTGRPTESAFKAIGDDHGYITTLAATGAHFRCHHHGAEAVAAIVPVLEAAAAGPWEPSA